mmetsp:Transcript_71989/g.158972  ORF Transcript_71989/g.158972 Transcript_71989/m.158972 type:complete len:327 (+) Transcript_71989:757-1737(+)
MGDQPGANDLADQSGQVGGHQIHLGLEVVMKGLSHICQFDDFTGEVLNVFHVHLDDILAHRHLQGFQNLIGHLFGATGLGQGLLVACIAISDTNNLGNLGIGDVVCDDPRELWKVPGVPLTNTHGEGVDVLVQVVQQGNGVHNGFVLTIGIQLHPMPAESVAKAKTCLIQVVLTQVLHQTVEVHAAPAEQLLHRLAVSDGELLRQGLPELGVVDAQLVALLFLRQVHLQKVHQFLRGRATGHGVGLVQGVLRIPERRPGVQLHDLTELFGIEDGILHLLFRFCGLFKFFFQEQGKACRTLVKQVCGHGPFDLGPPLRWLGRPQVYC